MNKTLSLIHSVDSPALGSTRLKKTPRIGIARARRTPRRSRSPTKKIDVSSETFAGSHYRFFGDISSACGLFTYRGREWSWRLIEFEPPIVVALEIHGPMDLARYPLIVRKKWRLRRAAA